MQEFRQVAHRKWGVTHRNKIRQIASGGSCCKPAREVGTADRRYIQGDTQLAIDLLPRHVSIQRSWKWIERDCQHIHRAAFARHFPNGFDQLRWIAYVARCDETVFCAWDVRDRKVREWNVRWQLDSPAIRASGRRCATQQLWHAATDSN